MAFSAAEIILLGVIVFLLVLLVVQQAFWQVQTNKLLNKIMSRNYAEYVQIENLKKPSQVTNKESKPQDPFEEDPVAAQQAQNINSMMGIF